MTDMCHSRLLVLIDSDPRTSPRPAEAVRVAAGVGAWRDIHVQLCLIGPACALAGDDLGAFCDGEELDHYLRMILGRGECPWVITEDAGRTEGKDAGTEGRMWRRLTMAELAGEIARMNWVLRF